MRSRKAPTFSHISGLSISAPTTPASASGAVNGLMLPPPVPGQHSPLGGENQDLPSILDHWILSSGRFPEPARNSLPMTQGHGKGNHLPLTGSISSSSRSGACHSGLCISEALIRILGCMHRIWPDRGSALLFASACCLSLRHL